MGGGNSHQRKMENKARERLADDVANRIVQQLEAKPAISGQPDKLDTNKRPPSFGAVLWLWERVWDWPFVAWTVAAICIGLAYLVAQEHMYLLSRVLIGLGAVMVFFKVRHDAAKADMRNEGKRAVSILTFLALALIGSGALWIIHEMEKNYLESRPRADLRVDDVTIEIQRVGVPAIYPERLIAHISGHNASLSVPTAAYPMVTAAISARPFITQDHVEEEEDLFASGKWGNERYAGLPYVLNPLQAFSFSKQEPFPTLNVKGVKDTGNTFFDNWNALARGDIVLYVVTRTICRDKWGAVPEVRTCSVFSARDDFKKRGTCSGQFKLGTYQP